MEREHSDGNHFQTITDLFWVYLGQVISGNLIIACIMFNHDTL